MSEISLKSAGIRRNGWVYGEPDRFAIAYMLGIPPGIREGRNTYEKNRVLGNDSGRRTR